MCVPRSVQNLKKKEKESVEACNILYFKDRRTGNKKKCKDKG
jgi:hypothetical protein